MSHPTVRDLLSHCAARHPDAEAVVDPAVGARRTFGEWDTEVTRVANGLLDLGLSRGDHFSVIMKDSIEQLTLLFAAAEIGAVYNPLSYRAPRGRISYIFDHAEPMAVAYDSATAETIAGLDKTSELLVGPEIGDNGATQAKYETLKNGSDTPTGIPISEKDPSLLLYTSGTTGKPKGVRHNHRSVVEADLMCLPYNRLRPSDTSIALGPLYHVGPLLANFMPAFHVGATNVLQRDFDPETTLEYIESEEITAIWGVPTHFNALIDADGIESRDVSDVRMIQYSGSAMPKEIVQRCRTLFPEVDFVNAYGTTEIIFGTFIYPEEHDERLGSIGRAIPNVEARVVDETASSPDEVLPAGETGELLIDTPTQMLGYWKDDEKTDSAMMEGWYRTGDLVRRDEDGYIYFVDRKDNMIVSGGENIYPAEVEDVLYGHSGVESVAVVGRPDEQWGEVVTAFIVPANKGVTAEVLDEFVRSSPEIEDFKRPRDYKFRDSLPKTQSGKIARSELKTEEEQ